MRTTAATDGGCIGNPGPGGWAWITEDGRQGYASAKHTTNNRMELRAILELLKAVSPLEPLTIQTDSQYAMNVFTKWLPQWKAKGMRTGRNKKVENQDLILAIENEMTARDVVFEWVRGHVGHPLNEEADRLANTAARRAHSS